MSGDALIMLLFALLKSIQGKRSLQSKMKNHPLTDSKAVTFSILLSEFELKSGDSSQEEPSLPF